MKLNAESEISSDSGKERLSECVSVIFLGDGVASRLSIAPGGNGTSIALMYMYIHTHFV